MENVTIEGVDSKLLMFLHRGRGKLVSCSSAGLRCAKSVQI